MYNVVHAVVCLLFCFRLFRGILRASHCYSCLNKK